LNISATKKGVRLESALAVLGFFWGVLEYNALAVFWTFFGVQRFSLECKKNEHRKLLL
jgi:hypothetical protein